MRYLTYAIVAVLMLGPVRADSTALTTEQIRDLLPSVVAVGTVKDTRQKFWPDGHTEYQESGHYSFGRWWAEDNKYCSTWPPSQAVSCYQVLRYGDALIWVPRVGDRITNRIEPR